MRTDARVGLGVKALLEDLELVSIDDGVAWIRPTANVRVPAEKRLHELGALVSTILADRVVAKLTPAEPGEAEIGGAPPEVETPPDENHPLVVAAKKVFGAEVSDSRRKARIQPQE